MNILILYRSGDLQDLGIDQAGRLTWEMVADEKRTPLRVVISDWKKLSKSAQQDLESNFRHTLAFTHFGGKNSCDLRREEVEQHWHGADPFLLGMLYPSGQDKDIFSKVVPFSRNAEGLSTDWDKVVRESVQRLLEKRTLRGAKEQVLPLSPEIYRQLRQAWHTASFYYSFLSEIESCAQLASDIYWDVCSGPEQGELWGDETEHLRTRLERLFESCAIDSALEEAQRRYGESLTASVSRAREALQFLHDLKTCDELPRGIKAKAGLLHAFTQLVEKCRRDLLELIG